MSIKKINPLKSSRLTISIFLLGLIFIAIGLWRDEHTIVMEKAINICLECIGIG
ncbi:CD1871A family CXXC motif-containing protein [Clostridium sp.]|uniref:CD1871A family CXXC motif-containing protein n=1 Tax=Clostridium sp. TaxID=1506 RepID=UPI002FC7B80E